MAFEADNEIDNSGRAGKTTNIYKQNPVCIGYYINSEMNYVLQSGYYECPLENTNVDWFVNEVIKKIESKMNFFLKNTIKNIMNFGKDEKFKNDNICLFSEKTNFSIKDFCQFTGNYNSTDKDSCRFLTGGLDLLIC